MNSKTLKLCVYDNNIRIPLTVSDLTEIENTIKIEISTGATFGFSMETAITNLIPNPSFEYPEASGSTIDSWTVEYPYWSRSYSGNNIFGERYASTALVINDGIRSITSGSFSVTPGQQYRTALDLRAVNGRIKYVNPYSGISEEEDLLPVYTAKILWYNGASLESEETIITGYGATYLGDELTDETVGYYGYIYIPEDWKLFRKTTIAPTGVDRGKLSVEAYYSRPLTYSSTAYKEVIKTPRIDIDDVNFYVSDAFISTSGSVLIETGTSFAIDKLTSETVDYELVATALEDDLYGEFDTGTIYSTETELMVGYGNFENRYLRSWIPFEIDFTSASGGVHITEATLEVVSTRDMPYMVDNPTRVQVGFESRISGGSPVTTSELWGIPLGEYPTNENIASSWTKGETYSFDITKSARGLFGIRGVNWTNGDKGGIIMGNWGSGLGAYRSIASSENTLYEPAQLKIKYQDNWYQQEMMDLTIMNQDPWNRKRFLDLGQLDNIAYRILMYFKVSGIPVNIQDVQATLYLYRVQNNVVESGNNYAMIYSLVEKFDYHTASWYKRYGTKLWDNEGLVTYGMDDPTDYTLGSIGSIDMYSTDSINEWVTVPLDQSLIEYWITKEDPGGIGYPENNGIFIRSLYDWGAPSNTHQRFISSQHENETLRPYLHITWMNTDTWETGEKIIKNTIYTETEPDPEETPGEIIPPPSPLGEQTILTSQNPVIKSYGMDSYDFNTSGHLDRYMLIFYFFGNPVGSGAEYTGISLGGEEFTKLAQSGTIFDGNIKLESGTFSQIWGLPIPDDWSGTKNFVTNLWSGTRPKTTYIFLLRNVDKDSPKFDSNSVYSTHSGAISASISVSCREKGAIYGLISLKEEGIIPNAVASTRIYYGTNNNQSGGISTRTPITSPNVSMGWSWGTGSRYSISAVSLRPAVR